MEMPIGLYKGLQLESVPTKYLAWLLSQDHIRHRRWPLIQAVTEVLQRRFLDLDALRAELRVEDPPPEYWKLKKR